MTYVSYVECYYEDGSYSLTDLRRWFMVIDIIEIVIGGLLLDVVHAIVKAAKRIIRR